ISSLGVDYTLARLYNDRTDKGLLAIRKLDDAIHQLQKARVAGDDFFDRIADWHARQPAGFNGRVRQPIRWSEVFCEELNKLATAIGQGAKQFDKAEERIELTAAETRCRVLAQEVSSWMRQAVENTVYWTEVEQKTRVRVRLAAAPLDVGPSLRRLLFAEVAT